MLRFLGLRFWEMTEPKHGWPQSLRWMTDHSPNGKFYFTIPRGVVYLATDKSFDRLDDYHDLITEELIQRMACKCLVRSMRISKQSQIPNFPKLLSELYQIPLMLPLTNLTTSVK